MNLRVAVRVQGQDPDGVQWAEMTTCEDTSYNGARFRLEHGVDKGQVVLLSMPMPKAFRHYDVNEPSYHTYGLVRTLQPQPPATIVSVFFLGRHAPRGHDKNPAARYLLPSDPKPGSQKERRLLPRLQIFVNLRLIRSQGQPQQEFTVAENLSKGGARVPTSLPVARGEVVTIEEVGAPLGMSAFKTRAEIRNVVVGKDNVPRLNLKFLDDQTPDRVFHIG